MKAFSTGLPGRMNSRFTPRRCAHSSNARPVDNSYTGPTELGGSSDAHWRSVIFHSEIMSPSGSSTDALSIVTIASMEDMGYAVDRSVADPWSPRLGFGQQLPGAKALPIDGTGAGPWYRIGNSGSLSIIRR